MKFFNTIWDSISSRSFYHGVSSHTNKQAWKYFILINLLVSILIYIGFVISTIPLFNELSKPESIKTFTDIFPKDLEITLKGGKLSTNQPEPYVVPLPKDLVDPKKPQKINLITINASSDFSYDVFVDSHSLAYATKDIIAYSDSHGEIKINSLKNVDDFVLNKNEFDSKVYKIVEIIKKLALIMLVTLAITYFVFTVISSIIFLALMSLIVWIIDMIIGTKNNFRKIFKEGLYLITPILILDIIVLLLNLRFSLLISIVAFLVVYQINIGFKK